MNTSINTIYYILTMVDIIYAHKYYETYMERLYLSVLIFRIYCRHTAYETEH